MKPARIVFAISAITAAVASLLYSLGWAIRLSSDSLDPRYLLIAGATAMAASMLVFGAGAIVASIQLFQRANPLDAMASILLAVSSVLFVVNNIQLNHGHWGWPQYILGPMMIVSNLNLISWGIVLVSSVLLFVNAFLQRPGPRPILERSLWLVAAHVVFVGLLITRLVAGASLVAITVIELAGIAVLVSGFIARHVREETGTFPVLLFLGSEAVLMGMMMNAIRDKSFSNLFFDDDGVLIGLMWISVAVGTALLAVRGFLSAGRDSRVGVAGISRSGGTSALSPSMPTGFCGNCGAQLRGRFCGNCGKSS